MKRTNAPKDLSNCCLTSNGEGCLGVGGVGVGDWVGVSDGGGGFREICSFLT